MSRLKPMFLTLITGQHFETGVGSLMAEQLAFPQADGGSIPTPTLQFNIMEISRKAARGWVEKWHYSRAMPTGKCFSYGLYANHEPYAVIVYGIGVNPNQASYLKVKNVLEILRMCRSEPKLKGFPLSRFIAITRKMVSTKHPYNALIAFADPEEGHIGTVYSAAGFKLEGVTEATWHALDKYGNKRHRRYAFRHARRNDQTIEKSRQDLGLTRVQTKPKYRWVYRLNN